MGAGRQRESRGPATCTFASDSTKSRATTEFDRNPTNRNPTNNGTATDISDYFTLQSANDYSAITRRGNPYKLLVNHCGINVRKDFFVSASLKYGIVCHQVLLILNHYHRLEIH